MNSSTTIGSHGVRYLKSLNSWSQHCGGGRKEGMVFLPTHRWWRPCMYLPMDPFSTLLETLPLVHIPFSFLIRSVFFFLFISSVGCIMGHVSMAVGHRIKDPYVRVRPLFTSPKPFGANIHSCIIRRICSASGEFFTLQMKKHLFYGHVVTNIFKLSLSSLHHISYGKASCFARYGRFWRKGEPQVYVFRSPSTAQPYLRLRGMVPMKSFLCKTEVFYSLNNVVSQFDAPTSFVISVLIPCVYRGFCY